MLDRYLTGWIDKTNYQFTGEHCLGCGKVPRVDNYGMTLADNESDGIVWPADEVCNDDCMGGLFHPIDDGVYNIQRIIVTESGQHAGWRLCIAWGGPGVWLDFVEGSKVRITGAWWGMYGDYEGIADSDYILNDWAERELQSHMWEITDDGEDGSIVLPLPPFKG